MFAWFALFAVTVILPALGIGPIIRRGGRRAWNNAVMVQLPPDDVTIAQDNDPAGRKAQERIDWVHRWLVALLIVSPLLFVLPDGALGELLMFLAAFIATVWSKLLDAHFELVGHGAEILVAGDSYRAGEIERMRTRDSTFKDWTTERIDAAVRSKEWLSRAFVGVYA